VMDTLTLTKNNNTLLGHGSYSQGRNTSPDYNGPYSQGGYRNQTSNVNTPPPAGATRGGRKGGRGRKGRAAVPKQKKVETTDPWDMSAWDDNGGYEYEETDYVTSVPSTSAGKVKNADDIWDFSGTKTELEKTENGKSVDSKDNNTVNTINTNESTTNEIKNDPTINLTVTNESVVV